MFPQKKNSKEIRIDGPETHPPPALLVSHPRWSDSGNFLTLSLHGCPSSDLFSTLLSVLILRRAPVWLWLIQLGSGSCSPWGKFTQLTADQLFSGALHGKKDHAAHMINNSRWRGKKKKRGHQRAVRTNMMNKKGFSVPQSPLCVSWDLILPHRIIDEARSRKQHSYENTRKLQIAGRDTQRLRVKKTNKNSNNNYKL